MLSASTSLLPLTLVTLAGPIRGQEPVVPDGQPTPLGELVVTATRGPHELFDLVRSMSIASTEDLAERNMAVGLDALNETIGIFVEKRNGASSDPILRGFSGANILALIDGNSLTSLWGEGGYAGDDMYGKVDGESIERIEVVRGPSSVLYGSNALGGVVHFITRGAPDYTGGDFAASGRLKTSLWSASNGSLLRGDFGGADDVKRFRIGWSVRNLGDVRGGGELGILSPSGIDDSNFDWSSEVRLSDSDTLEVTAQLVNRNGLTKYYRPTQTNDNDRRAVAMKWRTTDAGGLGDELSWGLYLQDKEDHRFWLDQDKQGVASWQTLATDLQGIVAANDEHLVTWGVHLNRDLGESPDDEQFTITTPATGEQKASPDSTWDNLGIFGQDEWDLGEGWALTTSARLDHFRYEADGNTFYTNPGSTAPENVAQTAPGTHEETALTGGLGLSRRLDEDWVVHGSWSRGYHLFAPGFGLRQAGYGVLAPTDGFLDPTTADQFELGTRVRREAWSFTGAIYYSALHDVQQPVPGTYLGAGSIDLDGSGTVEADESIFVTTGADGYVTGIELDSSLDLAVFADELDGWTWHNGFMTNYGRVEFDAGKEPLRHTHPPRYLTRVRWEDTAERGPWFEVVGDVVGRFDQVSDARLNGDPGYLKDPQDSSSGLLAPYGLPSYAVLHLRGGMDVGRSGRLTLGVENLFDTEYRTAHSRMDAPGMNLMLSYELSL